MELSRCETVADVLMLLEEDCSGEDTWQTFFTGVLDATGLSYGRFAARCGLSKNTVKRWSLQGGAPKSRDTYLKVGFGAAMTPEAVSHTAPPQVSSTASAAIPRIPPRVRQPYRLFFALSGESQIFKIFPCIDTPPFKRRVSSGPEKARP